MKHFIVFICILSLFSCKEEATTKQEMTLEEMKQLHEDVLTVDTHVDINVRNFTDSVNYTSDLDTQVTLPKMEKGGLDVAFFIVYTGQDTLSAEGYEKASENAISKFEAIHRLAEVYAPDRIGLATSSEEARKIAESGKLVAMIGVENAYPMGEDLANFEKYHQLGARYISLSHNGHSQFCDSNTGEEDNVWLYNGLSELGEKAVDEMNRLGIMIDLSHVSKESMLQIVARSKAPVIASHSSARALCDHSRNLDDEQLAKLKENGGVVQTVAFSAYLNAEKHAKYNEYMQGVRRQVADSMGVQWYDRSEIRNLDPSARQAFMEIYPKVVQYSKDKASKAADAPPAVDLSDFINHINYLVEKVGIDHVGISSDFDGGGGIEGWSDASETFNVTKALVEAGYKEEEIRKLWGGNLLRVLDEVQEVAKTMD